MERDKHETKFDNRECSENRSGICTAVFAVLFFADAVWHGGSVYHGTVLRRGQHHRRGKRQPGHAHDYRDPGGACHGATVIIGRAVGGNRMDEAGKAVGNTVTLFMVLAAALMAVLLCLARPIVILIGTPEEAVAETVQYLVI